MSLELTDIASVITVTGRSAGLWYGEIVQEHLHIPTAFFHSLVLVVLAPYLLFFAIQMGGLADRKSDL